MAKTEVLGIGEMKVNFAKLKTGMEQRTSRAMVVAAGGVLKRKAKSLIQQKGLVRTGSMLKNVAIKREPAAPAGTTQYNLGVRHGRDKNKAQKSSARLSVGASGRIVKRYGDDPFYWRFLEFGTAKRGATPFLGPALEQSKSEAIAAMEKRLQKEIAKP